MKLEVLNINGEATGRSVDLPDDIFGIEPNDHAIYLAVKQYLNNQRQGTHKSKERGEITGSTRKIKRQKGTGTARAGSIKSPLFVGGGRVFGPKPRDYKMKVNKKVKAIARNSALAYKARENSIRIIEDFDFDTPKTKEYCKVLKGLGVDEQRTLLVLDNAKPNVHLSARNVSKATVKGVQALNTYQILHANTLILSESVAEKFSA